MSRKVQLEYTGARNLLYSFTKSFVSFVEETRAVAESEANVLAALSEQFGIRLIETDSYDPDNIGFIKCASCVHVFCRYSHVLILFCYNQVEKGTLCRRTDRTSAEGPRVTGHVLSSAHLNNKCALTYLCLRKAVKCCDISHIPEDRYFVWRAKTWALKFEVVACNEHLCFYLQHNQLPTGLYTSTSRSPATKRTGTQFQIHTIHVYGRSCRYAFEVV